MVFTEDDVRLTQEQARQNSIPPGANAAVPTSGKKCKTCGKGKRSGGESFPRFRRRFQHLPRRFSRCAADRPGSSAVESNLASSNVTRRDLRLVFVGTWSVPGRWGFPAGFVTRTVPRFQELLRKGNPAMSVRNPRVKTRQNRLARAARHGLAACAVDLPEGRFPARLRRR